MAEPPRIFVSYAHEPTPEHGNQVLALSDRLRKDGLNCEIDQYVPNPIAGWARWMQNEVDRADFVLVVCTRLYHDRFMGRDSGESGKGVTWEGAIITQELYDAKGHNDSFVPVLFSRVNAQHIPVILRGVNNYDVNSDAGYDNLYRRLTGQHDTPRPDLGKWKSLPTKRRESPASCGAFAIPVANRVFAHSHPQDSIDFERAFLGILARCARRQRRFCMLTNYPPFFSRTQEVQRARHERKCENLLVPDGVLDLVLRRYPLLDRALIRAGANVIVSKSRHEEYFRSAFEKENQNDLKDAAYEQLERYIGLVENCENLKLAIYDNDWPVTLFCGDGSAALTYFNREPRLDRPTDWRIGEMYGIPDDVRRFERQFEDVWHRIPTKWKETKRILDWLTGLRP